MTPKQCERLIELMERLVKAEESVLETLKGGSKPLQDVTSSIINVDGPPKIPYGGWTVEEHRDCGDVDLSKMKLYLAPEQKGDGWIVGHDLREHLKDKPVLNSNVLDYLMEHPEFFPESWKEKTKEGYIQFIFFWGTIFRDGTHRYVRCVFFKEGGWQRYYNNLGNVWDVLGPSAAAS